MDEDDSKQSKFWLFYKSSKVCEKCERNTNMPVMLRCFNEAQLRQLPEEDPSVSRHHTDPECLSHTVCTAKPPDTCLEWFIMSQFCSKGQALGLSFITLQAYHTIVSVMWCFKCLLHWIQSQVSTVESSVVAATFITVQPTAIQGRETWETASLALLIDHLQGTRQKYQSVVWFCALKHYYLTFD